MCGTTKNTELQESERQNSVNRLIIEEYGESSIYLRVQEIHCAQRQNKFDGIKFVKVVCLIISLTFRIALDSYSSWHIGFEVNVNQFGIGLLILKEKRLQDNGISFSNHPTAICQYCYNGINLKMVVSQLTNKKEQFKEKDYETEIKSS